MPRPERPLDSDSPAVTFAGLLRDLRKSADLTYREMAKKVPCSARTLSAVASGHGVPSWNNVAMFIQACGIDAAFHDEWREHYDRLAYVRSATDRPDWSTEPDEIATWTQFVAGLRAILQRSGLSYQAIVDQSAGQLAKSTISDLLSGRVRADEQTVRAFLTACEPRSGIDVAKWLMAWMRVQGASRPRSNKQPEGPRITNECNVAQEYSLPGLRRAASRAEHRFSINEVRQLAQQGELAAAMTTPDNAREITSLVWEIAWPLVFRFITKHGYCRNHAGCSRGISYMEPDCLDRLHDATIAVIDHVRRNANIPIHNLDGWITARMQSATIDGYRRRRMARGALTRPRVPSWLRHELRNEPALCDFAEMLLTWVGNDSPATAQGWPIDQWNDQYVARTRDYDHDRRAAQTKVDIVLRAMRSRLAWFNKYVDRPLSSKAPKRLPYGAGSSLEVMPVLSTEEPWSEDEYLRTMRRDLLDEMQRLLSKDGAVPGEVVASVLRAHLDHIAQSSDRGWEDLTAPGWLSEVEVTSKLIAAVLEAVAEAGKTRPSKPAPELS